MMEQQTIVMPAPAPLKEQILFTHEGFTVEVCLQKASLSTAFRLRYEAYRQGEVLPPNESRMVWDHYDLMPNSFIHLVWLDGKPVATVRACIYAEAYQWEKTEGLHYFPKVVAASLGEEVCLLESNRYAVAPEFQGRKSLFAQMLMFRIHALNSAAHGCTHIITAVRTRHIPFYRRFLGFEPLSEEVRKIAWLDATVALLAVEREKSYAIALEKGVPPISQEDIQDYARLAGIYETINS